MSCEEAVIKVEYAGATFEVKEWVVHVKGDNVSDRLSGPHHKLDIAFSARNASPERFLPHGIIGESLSSPDMRLGTLAPYPTEGHFAVGFAETVEDGLKLYELPSAYATDFVFSRFDDAERTVKPGLVDADSHGVRSSILSFFSAPNLAVNVKTEGGVITSAHLVARVGGAKRELLNVSFWADELNQFNTGWKLVNGTCDGDFFRLGLGASMSCEEAVIKVEYAGATFEVKEWVVHVKGDNVSDRLSGPHHKLDIAFSARNAAPGAINARPGLAVGFAESALAKEGLQQQELPFAFATDFASSRFDDVERAASTRVGADPKSPPWGSLFGKVLGNVKALAGETEEATHNAEDAKEAKLLQRLVAEA